MSIKQIKLRQLLKTFKKFAIFFKTIFLIFITVSAFSYTRDINHKPKKAFQMHNFYFETNFFI